MPIKNDWHLRLSKKCKLNHYEISLFVPVRLGIDKKTSAEEDMEEGEASYTVSGTINEHNHFAKHGITIWCGGPNTGCTLHGG